MAGPWDAPPTPEELAGGDPWATPPTPEEVGTVAAPRPRPLPLKTKLINAIGRGAWSLPGLAGLGYETAGAAELAVRDPERLGGSIGDRFRRYRSGLLGQSRRTDQESPIVSGLVRGIASAPGEALTWAAAPEVKLAQGARFLEKAATYGPRLGLLSGASEYGATAHKDPLDRVGGAAAAALAGTAIGGGMAGALPNPAALAPVRQASERIAKPPRIATTPEAQRLLQEGIDLTPGQRAPESTIGVIERASAAQPFGLGPQRASARDAFVRVAQDKGAAPGARRPTSLDPQARLAELFEGFDPAYGRIKDAPIPASVVAELPEEAIRTQGGIDAATRAKVTNEVGNALTVIPGVEWHPPGMHGGGGRIEVRGLTPEAPGPFALMRPARGGEAYRGGEFPPSPSRGALRKVDRKEMLATAAERAKRREAVGPPTERLIPGTTRPNPAYEWRTATAEAAPPPEIAAGDLLKVRENIRTEFRVASKAEDFDRMRLLEHAEGLVTDALEKALSPEQRQLLRDTDRQYARLMTAANAAPAGRTTFTPSQYLRQVEKSAGRRNFKKGQAGDLQDLGEAARDVLETELPMTGVRPGILSFMPFAEKWGAPVARLANTRPGRRFLFDPRVSRPSLRVRGGLLMSPTQATEAMRARLGLSAVSADGEEESP